MLQQNLQPSTSSKYFSPKKFGGDELRVLIALLVVTLFLLNMVILGSHEKLLHGHFPDEKRQARKLQSLPEPPHEPKLVWLMSFPNSGTSFTSRLVRDATMTVSASNYADETPSGQSGLVLPVYRNHPEGPFWIKPEASPDFSEPDNYILTKVSKSEQIILSLIFMRPAVLTLPFCSYQ
jgi:hypothetical protein